MSTDNPLFASQAHGPWGNDRQCPAQAVLHEGFDAGVMVTCDYYEGHPELHWDKDHALVWVHWTEEQEAECR